MSTVEQGRSLSKLNRLGGVLVVLAFIAVVVAYPPPATGLNPFLGVGNMFLPLIVSVVSLPIAIVGGIFLARGFTETQSKRGHRLIVRVLVPVSAVTVISVYLVIVAGFAPQSSFIIAAGVLAIVGGVADEVIN